MLKHSENVNIIYFKDRYKCYDNNSSHWETIFLEIENQRQYNKGFIINVSAKYNIHYETLKKKYKKWKNNKVNYREYRGGHNKYFTYSEENEIYNYITCAYINKNYFIDDECLRGIVIEKYYSLHSTEMNDFNVSNGWIYYYKKRWHLSTLVSTNVRKTNQSAEEIKFFYELCMLLTINVPVDNIFNIDETYWRVVFAKRKVIGHTNSENRKLLTNGCVKSGFTTIFLISKNGYFHKPIIIMKGKTCRCLEKIGNTFDNDIIKKFTESGWIDVNIMKFILFEIHKLTKGFHAILILDKYSVHKMDIIQLEARKLNIKLIYVPKGNTAKNQPTPPCGARFQRGYALQCIASHFSANALARVGPIKAIGRRIMKHVYIKNPEANFTIENAVASLVMAKKMIKSETIIESFKKACFI
jgi:DDE superfamily endonuclease